MDSTTKRRLNNGVQMPVAGLGMWRATGEESVQAVRWALQAGYRHIDTAAVYKNEREVGEGIRQSGLPREALFITTKLWNSEQLNGTQQAAFEASLAALGVDYIDLYLIHWPVPGKYKETWKILEALAASGRVRAIGVSNFHRHHLEDLLQDAKIVPALNQIELHPHLNQADLCAYCQQQGIAVESWRPLGGGKSNLLQDAAIAQIARRHGKSNAQVILRWILQRDINIIPKSVHKARISENIQLFDFALSPAEMETMMALHTGTRYGEDPDAMQNSPKLMATEL